MGVFEILQERGFIAQTTNEEKIKDLLNKQNITFYIGFDPTADSLHIGHFIPIMVISHLQKAGHTPIVLFGGGTGLIGDPTGKTDMRKMLTNEMISHNIDCFKNQTSKLIDFSKEKAIVVNNADWLANLNYIDFLREVGVHFSVNRMLSFECYKQRLERGLSFFELNYMLMQSYDFLVLNRKYGCVLELGGDDQWSNIIGGVELVRKKENKDVFGMTFALLTNSEGKKMGKTEKGALWLDAAKTSPYEFYQYWRNIDDKDVIKCLKMLTFFPIDEIIELSKLEGQELNRAKEILALEVTAAIHGKDEATKAHHAAKTIFCSGQDTNDIPFTCISTDAFSDGKISIIELLTISKLASSNGEARRLIEQGGISVLLKNETKKVLNINESLALSDFAEGFVIIKKGKKVFHKIVLKK